MTKSNSAVTDLSRRAFLVASSCGLVGTTFGQPAVATAGQAGRAKSTILFFLCGGASHIDTWDMKPHAPAEIRGEFRPIATSAPGVWLCEHLPLTARQAHHLAVINSVDGTDPTNSHLGYYYHLTGHALDPRTIKASPRRFMSLARKKRVLMDNIGPGHRGLCGECRHANQRTEDAAEGLLGLSLARCD